MTRDPSVELVEWFTRDDPPGVREAWLRQLAAIRRLEPCACPGLSHDGRPYPGCAGCRGTGQVRGKE